MRRHLPWPAQGFPRRSRGPDGRDPFPAAGAGRRDPGAGRPRYARTPAPPSRIRGYTNGSGENIAAGYGTPAAVMTGWMNSSGHRANIVNCSSAAIGKGGSYGTYWTQDVGYS
ncbi:MAG TPA: CAP domain-containing protein [Ornithinibacter sp.]|nr:CAP domain-containing protein [Ornithinibacter sp.]